GLMDRELAAIERLALLRDDLADHDPVPELGEAGRGHQTDPAGSDHANRLPLAHGRLGQVPGSCLKPTAIFSMSTFETVSSSEFDTQNEPWSVCQATIRRRSPS